MKKSEDDLAAAALADMLVSAMFRAIEENRTMLFVWERNACMWLIRYMDKRWKDALLNDWTVNFIELNRNNIIADTRLDFNLKAYKRLAKTGR
jgi:hypothetical protein